MEQAAAGVHQALIAEQQRDRREAVVIAAETLYRQVLIDRKVDMFGPGAEIL